jgi:hypothetical protein
VGLRAGLDTEARGKSFACTGDLTPVVQSPVRHYSDGGTGLSAFKLPRLLLRNLHRFLDNDSVYSYNFFYNI